jgi:hypothetical protein
VKYTVRKQESGSCKLDAKGTVSGCSWMSAQGRREADGREKISRDVCWNGRKVLNAPHKGGRRIRDDLLQPRGLKLGCDRQLFCKSLQSFESMEGEAVLLKRRKRPCFFGSRSIWPEENTKLLLIEAFPSQVKTEMGWYHGAVGGFYSPGLGKRSYADCANKGCKTRDRGGVVNGQVSYQ